MNKVLVVKIQIVSKFECFMLDWVLGLIVCLFVVLGLWSWGCVNVGDDWLDVFLEIIFVVGYWQILLFLDVLIVQIVVWGVYLIVLIFLFGFFSWIVGFVLVLVGGVYIFWVVLGVW